MSITSIALIALAIHVAGPELDENEPATLQRFVQSRPEATWTVSSDVPGTYTTDGEDASIHIERLSTTAGSYTLVQRDDVGAIRAVGVVVYDDPLPIGWRRGTEDAISIPSGEVIVAFHSVDVSTEESTRGGAGIESSSMDPIDTEQSVVRRNATGDIPVPESSSLDSDYEVIRRDRLITVAHEATGEVVILSY